MMQYGMENVLKMKSLLINIVLIIIRETETIIVTQLNVTEFIQKMNEYLSK